MLVGKLSREATATVSSDKSPFGETNQTLLLYDWYDGRSNLCTYLFHKRYAYHGRQCRLPSTFLKQCGICRLAQLCRDVMVLVGMYLRDCIMWWCMSSYHGLTKMSAIARITGDLIASITGKRWTISWRRSVCLAPPPCLVQG